MLKILNCSLNPKNGGNIIMSKPKTNQAAKKTKFLPAHESIILLIERAIERFVKKATNKPDKNLEKLMMEFMTDAVLIEETCVLLSITDFPTEHIKDIIQRLRKILADITLPEVQKNTLCQDARKEIEGSFSLAIKNLESRPKKEKSE